MLVQDRLPPERGKPHIRRLLSLHCRVVPKGTSICLELGAAKCSRPGGSDFALSGRPHIYEREVNSQHRILVRSGIIPILRLIFCHRDGGGRLRLVPTPVVSQLTGLSTETLREWTRRRGLVHADVVPKQKGSPAQFSWQTILVLRIALQLRNSFHVELEAYKTALLNLQQELRVKSFIELWGKVLTLHSDGTWELTSSHSLKAAGDRLLLELDPHLQILHTGFSMTDDEVMREQLDLFSLPNLHRQRVIQNTSLLTKIQKTR